jgi:hypothetical protein
MKKLLLVVVSLLLISCASTSGPTPQELIIGTWQGNFDGQSITLTYDAEEVTVEEFGMSFPYEWVGENSLKLDAMGQEVTSTVEFITPNEMRQTSDQGVQTMTRVVN